MGEGPATVRARSKKARRYAAAAVAAVMGAGLAVGASVTGASAAPHTASPATPTSGTATPIKHLVVIFQENISFDHYFGTYPYAPNTDGNPFHAKAGTPKVNGLYAKITPSGPVGPLLTQNPNLDNPTRLTPSQAATCDQDHGYTPEQKAVNGGKMDKFVQNTESAADCNASQPTLYFKPGLVMDYFDGNTVTGLWNYAQNYAMSDNNYDTEFGPSTPGALNLVSGQTGSSYAVSPTNISKVVPDPGTVSALNSDGLGTIYDDLDPAYDDCSNDSHASSEASFPLGVSTAPNIGNLLNAEGITWGLVPGRVRPDRDQRGRLCRLRLLAQEHRRRHGAGLRAAPQPVPVLQVHRQPQAPAAVIGGGHRAHRPRQPPVRPVPVLRHPQGREPAGGQLPQGGCLPGWPRGLLQPDR
jgi:phospholipase C